ncbi:hypothetical protein LWI29_004958 [Acer saccharum]|uniref:Uncharacterized protein n=1 Tax=Acer saccharum TaxID=4024 RepID=A0AA39S2H2_ACESA|nr:hypothetical protein LWI29_004958 [Acer saccharum]
MESVWRSDLYRRMEEQSAPELAREIHLIGDQCWGSSSRDDNQNSLQHQQGPATGKEWSRSDWEDELHPMEEERRNIGEQVKAPLITEKMAKSSEGDMVTLGSSEVDMRTMGSEV